MSIAANITRSNKITNYNENDLSIIGNGETCALVDSRSNIVWLCLPAFDDFPFISSVLDPDKGGKIELGIKVRYGRILWAAEYGILKQRYLSRTNILVSEWQIGPLRLKIHNFMPFMKKMILWKIDIYKSPILDENNPFMGDLSLYIKFTLTKTLLENIKFIWDNQGEFIYQASRGEIPFKFSTFQEKSRLVKGSSQEIIREVQLLSEDRNKDILYLSFTYGDWSGVIEEYSRDISSIHQLLEENIRFWNNWLSQGVSLSLPDKEVEEAFERSLLLLKLLIYYPRGSILAAPTSSFAGIPGGSKNWDYRFCWIRDGCLIAESLDRAGFQQEGEKFYKFIFDTLSRHRMWECPLYSINGDLVTEEKSIYDLVGRNGEWPIRIGNEAAGQLQLDAPGSIMYGSYLHYLLYGNADFLDSYFYIMREAADWTCSHWSIPENGIWEEREQKKHWLYGKLTCFLSLKYAIRFTKILSQEVPSKWEKY